MDWDALRWFAVGWICRDILTELLRRYDKRQQRKARHQIAGEH